MSRTNEIREAAEADLTTFIRLVDKNRMLGHIHEDVIRWWTREDAKSHQLLLLPRDHMKSALVAFRVAWEITRDPTLRVLYISSTSNLAQKQLGFIKGIITSPVYRRYWPDHVQEEEGKRKKWTESEIALDHPLREEHLVRDPTVFTAGLTTSITGLHCDIAVLDDVVVIENAYTSEGRNKVKTQYSLLSSIEGAGAKEWVVGTRYHPKDLYNDMLEMEEDIYDEQTGEIVGAEPIYEIFEAQVEDIGDGTGTFLWPRVQRSDGKWFGFDRGILAKKRAQYLDRLQFRAQYYNDPSDPDNRAIDYANFQYWNPASLRLDGSDWYYDGRKLNLVAAIDFAVTATKRSDFTAIVIVGQDHLSNIYVLDIAQFKTDRISGYYEELLRLIKKWGFRKLRAETTAAQAAIVKELREMYLKPNGLFLKIEEHKPNRYEGSKEERINAILEPRYDNMSIFHGRGGSFEVLESELVSDKGHDDIKDALAAAIESSIPPSSMGLRKTANDNKVVYHPRFGGRSF